MDSPLNLAHQQGRRADQLLKSGKIEDAISCHNKAAGYLLDAMQLTQYQGAMESLKLQHSHYVKQADHLYNRQRRAQLIQLKRIQAHLSSKGLQSYMTDKATQTPIQEPITAVNAEQQNPQQESKPAGAESPQESEDDPTYHTITEQDSLIGLLLRRQQSSGLDGEENYTNFHSGVPVERMFHDRRPIVSLADDMKLAMENEELRCINDDLRAHVKELLREVSQVKNDNSNLREKVEGRQLPSYSDAPGEMDMIPDLPPLDMPTFDTDMAGFNFQEYGKKLSGLSFSDAETSFDKSDMPSPKPPL